MKAIFRIPGFAAAGRGMQPSLDGDTFSIVLADGWVDVENCSLDDLDAFHTKLGHILMDERLRLDATEDRPITDAAELVENPAVPFGQVGETA